ncbi:MAG: Fe-S protein assembly co-chaperone HscB [Rhodocyclaceae bacterium]|nr:Fe-S protein assembly co-chaperone HscB [Rhodocyclaceae bacterium]
MDFTHNHFQLFGLAPAFRIDVDALEKSYRELQGRVHPDRYAHLPDTEKRLSMQWATRANEAFQALKKPLSRAIYLLELAGVDVAHQSNTAMSPAFLMEQMEWREAVEEAEQARDTDELEALRHRLMAHGKDVQAEAERALDDSHDLVAAADAVRRLMFIEKLRHDIEDALETLES